MKWMGKYENGLNYIREMLYQEGIGYIVVDKQRIDGWLDELNKKIIQLEKLPYTNTNQFKTEYLQGIHWDIVNLMKEFSISEIVDELNKIKTIYVRK